MIARELENRIARTIMQESGRAGEHEQEQKTGTRKQEQEFKRTRDQQK
jgi:hypothetical protein